MAFFTSFLLDDNEEALGQETVTISIILLSEELAVGIETKVVSKTKAAKDFSDFFSNLGQLTLVFYCF